MTLKHMAHERLRELPHEHRDQARRAHRCTSSSCRRSRRASRTGHAGSIMCAYSRISQSDTGLRHLLVRQQPAAEHDRARQVRLHRLGAHRLRRGPPPQRHPRRRRLGNAEWERRRIRDEPDPGNLTDPPANNNVFANGAGFPGGAPGSGKTLTQAVLNGTNAIPSTATTRRSRPPPARSGWRLWTTPSSTS